MKKLVSLVTLAGALALPATQTGCTPAQLANLPAVVQDVAAIAGTVISDIEAGKPFATVLADTGTEDATLLIALIGAVEGDAKLDAATKAHYVAVCAPYLQQAQQLAAKQASAKQ